jgi:hypothetical protein
LGDDVACLVFASANPGGGFHNGAQAREESIARFRSVPLSTGLPAVLRVPPSGNAACSTATRSSTRHRCRSSGPMMVRCSSGPTVHHFLTSAAPKCRCGHAAAARADRDTRWPHSTGFSELNPAPPPVSSHDG